MWLLSTTAELLSGPQSALAPAGPHARDIATLAWIMFAGASAIFVLVMVLLVHALRAPPRWLAGNVVIVLGGIAFPVLVLSALLVYGLTLTRTIAAAPQEPGVEIEVVGEQFWWRVRYRSPDGSVTETANEVHLPVGRPARLRLSTTDVIHSFWIPRLGGKLDMIPGQVNTLLLRADMAGTYRGQCAEFCGAAHALMAFDVVVHDAPDFEAWLEAQRQPAAAPATQVLRRGRELFMASGCGTCHAIRGTAAAGEIGPDLTHVGGRRSIAAASMPNGRNAIASWITGSQHLKPGSKMPPFDIFSGEELRAIASYLESLK